MPISPRSKVVRGRDKSRVSVSVRVSTPSVVLFGLDGHTDTNNKF